MRRLIIRPGAIGDFIVSLPALHHLQAPYTEVWTTEANLPLVPAAFARRTIISTGLDRLGIVAAEEVLTRLREFDSIVSWYGANRPDFRQLVATAGLPFEFHTALPRAGTGIHAVDYYCAQVGAPAGAIPSLDVGAVEPHGCLVVHPFASSPAKRWPGALTLELPNLVRLRGPEEQLPGALFLPDLLELARFLAGARAYLGNDSGITHLAAAVGVPVLALFGPTDPSIWGPRGRNVRILHVPRLAELTPETVIDALRNFGL
jgi:heptosyltransferase-3